MMWFLLFLLFFQTSSPVLSITAKERDYPPTQAPGTFSSPSLPFYEGVAPRASLVEGATQAPEIVRFCRMGDGRITIKNTHNGLQADVRLLDPDGLLNKAALDAVDRVFGYSPAEDGDHISPRLLFLLDYFSDKFAPGKALQLQSGYRDPEYNQRLRKVGRNVALTSAHMDAMAIDFFIDGVEGKFLWDMIRKEACCGVGHYGGKTIHLDSGKPRFWEAATSKVSSRESESNRRIYLSTQYDRYKPGELVRLSLVSISDFGFGVAPDMSILGEDGSKMDASLVNSREKGIRCIPISDRKSAKSLMAALPRHLPPGRYRLHVRFCDKPSVQMPSEISSNPIEVVQ